MSRSEASICIACGQPAHLYTGAEGSAGAQAERARLNRLDDGRPCSTCADRLLETMPSLLPGQHETVQGQTDAPPSPPPGEKPGADHPWAG